MELLEERIKNNTASIVELYEMIKKVDLKLFDKVIEIKALNKKVRDLEYNINSVKKRKY